MRPKHPKPDLEKVLREAEAKNWRVILGGKYWKIYCPCDGKHKKSVHLSPSDPNYKKNLLGQLMRATCWSKVEGKE